MDGSHFDTLVRSLVTARSRRSLTRLLGGLSLGGVLTALGADSVIAALLPGGYRCTKDSQCKTGNCLASGQCSCSQAVPRCKQPSNPCRKATCNFATNRCVISNRMDGSDCGSGKVCCTGQCKECCTTNDCPTPACQTCSAQGTCEPLTDGTPCGTQSEPGGTTIRCCNGTCPDPDCVPSGNTRSGCIPACENCCAQENHICSLRPPFICDCLFAFPSDTATHCGSDNECSVNTTATACICGTCQVPPA